MTLEVRCCCTPENLLGWVHGVPVRRPMLSPHVIVIFGDGSRETLELAMYHEPGREPYMALKSHEIPIERWRTLKNFEERRS